MGLKRGRHRRPPKPHYMRCSTPGRCKFCGDPIIRQNGKVNKRATWHSHCALKWTIMNSPTDARKFVFLRDRGICKDCGKNCAPGNGSAEVVASIIEQIMTPPNRGERPKRLVLGRWELDHVIPLSEAARLGNPPGLWQLGNMATRCPACHSAKTKNDKILYNSC